MRLPGFRKVGVACLFATGLLATGCLEIAGPAPENASQAANPNASLLSAKDSIATADSLNSAVAIGKVGKVTVNVVTSKCVIH